MPFLLIPAFLLVILILVLLKHSAKREIAWEIEQTRKADARFRTRYLNAAFGNED